MAATILTNIIAIESSNGRVYKLDRVAKQVTIYADATKYAADDSIGVLPQSEFKEIFEYIRDASK